MPRIYRAGLAFCGGLSVQYVSMSDAMDLLRSVKDRTDDTEFYTPLPQGYRVGSTKYVVVLGTVISGLARGFSHPLSPSFFRTRASRSPRSSWKAT